MKNQKGVTMVSLIMYVILMIFIVAGITSITTSFYNNISELDRDAKGAVDFAKFNMILLNDIKAEEVAYEDKVTIENTDPHKKNKKPTTILKLKIKEETVSYTIKYEDKYENDNKIEDFEDIPQTLYRNDVKISGDIQDQKIDWNSSNKSITIYLKIKGYEKTTIYAIEPKIV